jgi:hypothetical protein
MSGSTEGVIGVYIAKLLIETQGQNTGIEVFKEEIPPTEDDDEELNEKRYKKGNEERRKTNFMLARPTTLFGGIGSKCVPEIGQVVYCFMEDNDPQKLYYINLTPTLLHQGLTIPASRFSKENILDKKKSANVVVPIELPNGNLIVMDYNDDTNSIEISFGSGTGIYMCDNENESYIELMNENNFLKLDNKDNKIEIQSKGDLEGSFDGNVRIKGKNIYLN